ncbi:MAG: YggS family pyridoxal phosphate-dependent enzyme [Spirochaetales bacterium]|nr:MAG: YggS family pyridoxal phosphate-dependent enzyme [Spirochaetales bacterium]
MGYEPGTSAYNRAVADAVEAVRETVARACAVAGRKPAGVSLLAVSKFNPVEAVMAAYAAGLRLFGENRVQEAEEKFVALKASYPDIQLHLLGHLQTNKARKAIGLFDCIQSVDSEKLLVELARHAEASGVLMDILFELHTGEESKSGFADADQLYRAFDVALSLPMLRPRGLMTMAPYTDDAKAIRASFRACRVAFDELAARHVSSGWDIVSMGMTNDYPLAIEEGSTLIRIGAAIFGERAYP